MDINSIARMVILLSRLLDVDPALVAVIMHSDLAELRCDIDQVEAARVVELESLGYPAITTAAIECAHWAKHYDTIKGMLDGGEWAEAEQRASPLVRVIAAEMSDALQVVA